MFEHECVEEDYATRVYPCLGQTQQWMGSCEKVFIYFLSSTNWVYMFQKIILEYTILLFWSPGNNKFNCFFQEISEYSVLREKVNNKINSVYNSAIQTVKSLKERREQVFTDTMKFINYAEGSKCLAFKKVSFR